ncbi:unnamed protein product [Psylliodes chrysocephalus]|uniref:Uncharacterized protein n=1 Tax=Psylliodes chrysocephalus TaxID=3402493 RepID=A0A9P0CS17_9CUCU|nr:unnamed protein product [Psylliodes chrysocephala]
MLDWPFCVGLIIRPSSLACRIRGSAAQNELVTASIACLKPLLLSRRQACSQMEGRSDAESVDSQISGSFKAPRTSRLDNLEKSNMELKNMAASLLEKFDTSKFPAFYRFLEKDKGNLSSAASEGS